MKTYFVDGLVFYVEYYEPYVKKKISFINVFMETIGKRIRKIRKDARMTQKKFAPEVGMVHNYLSQIENGHGNAGRGLIKSIAARFNVHEHWIRTGQGPQYISEDIQEIAAITDAVTIEVTRPASKPPIAYLQPPEHMLPRRNGLAVVDKDDRDRSDIDHHRVTTIMEGEITWYLDMVRKILTSDDLAAKEAMKSSIKAFLNHVESKQEMDYLRKEVQKIPALEEKLSKLLEEKQEGKKKQDV